MALYYFSIANDHRFNDTDGLELPDLAAVRAEAIGFARDLMLMEPARREWSSWAIQVTDEARIMVLNLAFSEAL
ncbi:MAG TPA: hypothetical protein VHT02_05635 [Methylocella sp.]|nr:hypothetical protein [Methylocella sp.]